MFKRRTLLVVGAGASAEANLPIGSDLALAISKKLDIRFDDWGQRHIGGGDIELFQNLLRTRSDQAPAHVAQAQEIQQACWLIRDGIHLANSIDDFLDLHGDNATLTLVGKAAVAKCILEAEKHSNLHYNWRDAGAGINFPNLHATWFTKFMKTVARGVPVQKAETIFENISFVNFNYDRCIQHFILHAIQRLYGMSEPDAASICNTIRVRHPYGTLAPIATTAPKHVRFGESDRANCAALAANIKTYTEQIEDREELAQIRLEVETAECLIFLGFAFHEQNMRLLAPLQKMKPKPVYATAFRMSKEDADECRHQIARMFTSARDTIHLHNQYKCADLFENYSKSIAG